FEDLGGFVSGAAVDDDIFDPVIILRKDAFDGLGQVSRHVERRRDDADQGALAHGKLYVNTLVEKGLELPAAARAVPRVHFGTLDQPARENRFTPDQSNCG